METPSITLAAWWKLKAFRFNSVSYRAPYYISHSPLYVCINYVYIIVQSEAVLCMWIDCRQKGLMWHILSCNNMTLPSFKLFSKNLAIPTKFVKIICTDRDPWCIVKLFLWQLLSMKFKRGILTNYEVSCWEQEFWNVNIIGGLDEFPHIQKKQCETEAK